MLHAPHRTLGIKQSRQSIRLLASYFPLRVKYTLKPGLNTWTDVVMRPFRANYSLPLEMRHFSVSNASLVLVAVRRLGAYKTCRVS